MANIKSFGFNDSQQTRSRILKVSFMEVTSQNSNSGTDSVLTLMSPFTDNDKSRRTSDKMKDETENMEDDNDENKNNTGFSVTGSEPLLPTLNNIKVTKRKAINKPTLTQSRRTGSSAADGVWGNSGGRLSNNRKERIVNNRPKKRALPKNDAKQTGKSFVPDPVDVYNSPRTELSSTKCVCEELCNTIALWKKKSQTWVRPEYL